MSYFLFYATVLGLCSSFYLLPTIISAVRQKPLATVAAVNVLLGWTLVGWVVALSWALKAEELT